MGVALSSAILAALAAVTALLAGHHANEAMVEQIQASDRWSYYQAKGIKAAVLASKHDLLQALGRAAADHHLSARPSGSPGHETEKLAEYKKEQEEIRKEAEEKEAASRAHLAHHLILARGVTLFQVAIAVAAIAVLTRRRRFWFVSLGFGALGALFLLQGVLTP